jgi:LPS export ABC transporter protein LptC
VRSLAALALLALGATGCARKDASAAAEPLQRLEDVQLSQETLGSPAWSLRAQTATLKQGDAVAELEKPLISFYKKRKEVSRVSAAMGVLQTETSDVTLSTSVIVHSLEDDTTLKTEELIYSSKRKKFYTDREVIVRRPGGNLIGKGLEASPDLTDIRIFNQRTVIDKAPR